MIAPLYLSLVGFLILTAMVLISILLDNVFNRRRDPWIPYPVRVVLYGVFYLAVGTAFLLLLAVDPV